MITDRSTKKELLIENQRIPVWIYGDNSRPLVFFIHGYFRGFSDMIGDLPMRHLMKNYCVVTFDLPGFGHSKELKMDRVSFIDAVIHKIANGRSYFLFGISYGGLLAVRYASQARNGFKGIIIGGMPYFYGLRKLLSLSYMLPFLKSKKISTIIKEFNYLNNDSLRRLSTPVLLLNSSKDKYATQGMGRKIDSILPSSTLYITKGLSHKWLMHRIDQSGFLNEITTFLKANL